jgi:hypothetical protein
MNRYRLKNVMQYKREEGPAFLISIVLGSAESDLYCSVGATFIQIID